MHNARKLLDETRVRGYDGGYSQLKLAVTPWREEGSERAFVRFENGSENAPMLVTSLNCFSALVNEVAETPVGEDYWKHMQHKVTQLERMWLDRTPAAVDPKDEMRETK